MDQGGLEQGQSFIKAEFLDLDDTIAIELGQEIINFKVPFENGGTYRVNLPNNDSILEKLNST